MSRPLRPNRLDQLLHECTVKIYLKKGSGYGTGFFIAPGFILTCAHVTREAVGTTLQVLPNTKNEPIEAEIFYYFPDELDLAILRYQSSESYKCVYLDTEIQPRDYCYTYGYTKEEADGDPVTVECEGLTGRNIYDLKRRIKLKSGQVTKGLSGSPLLNQRTGKVCGVMGETRTQSLDLGGFAIPLDLIPEQYPVIQELNFHYQDLHVEWTNLLENDVEAFESDWTYLDQGLQKLGTYFRVLRFLLRVLIKWVWVSRKVPEAFPTKKIKNLIRYIFKRKLGQEIKQQYHEVNLRLSSEVDPTGENQAQILNHLDSQAAVLIELINMLIRKSQDEASKSRLLWVSDILFEQRSLIQEVKQGQGNSYSELENFNDGISFQEKYSDGKYLRVSRITSRLTTQYVGESRILLFFIKNNLNEFIKKFVRDMRRFKIVYLMAIPVTEFLLELDDLLISSPKLNPDALLEDLGKQIDKNRNLQILQNIYSLVEATSGVVITGGAFRAKTKSGKYHFNRSCDRYLERGPKREMNQYLCYKTLGEADANHEPCKICLYKSGFTLQEFRKVVMEQHNRQHTF